MQSIGIIGYGRFGKLLASLLAPHAPIVVCDDNSSISTDPFERRSLTEVAQCDNLIIAVPVQQFANVIEQLAPLLTPRCTVLDVCSVKLYPSQIMQNKLPEGCTLIATHPLFGPDSVDIAEARQITTHLLRGDEARYQAWQQLFQKAGMRVIEMSPEQHDKAIAETQAVSHLVGRLLTELDLTNNHLNTMASRTLAHIVDYTNQDSWELFYAIESYNPYAVMMREQLARKLTELNQQLNQLTPDKSF